MRDKLILYEDSDMIVCHKPAGIPVQSARLGQKDMVSILNNYLAEKRGEAVEPIKVVHRLDQPVEGVIVFAKTKRAAAGLGRQIAEGSMKKIYHAVCCVTERASGQEWYKDIESRMPDKAPDENMQSRMACGRTYQLVDYLIRDGRANISCVADKGKKDAKRAELSYRILGAVKVREKRYLLAEIELKTGRRHQIRVQMAHAGLPLYGDTKYNDEWEEYRLDFDTQDRGTVSDRPGYEVSGRLRQPVSGNPADGTAGLKSGGSGRKSPGLALCAVSLTFCHPVSGRQMTFEVKPKAEVFALSGNIFSAYKEILKTPY